MDWDEVRAASWKRCLEAYRKVMLKVASDYAGSVIGAEDIVQEAVLIALVRFDGIQDEAEPGPLLVGITRNVGRQVAKKRLRREELRSKHLVQEARSVDPQAAQDEPDKRLDSVLHMAESLPESQQDVLLYRLLGLSHKEIAARVEKSEGAVRVLYHRAVKTLVKAFLLGSSPVVVGGERGKLNHRAGWEAFTSEAG